jgi:ATP-dependent protease ClpP protease subunit
MDRKGTDMRRWSVRNDASGGDRLRELLAKRRPVNKSGQWYRFENAADETAHVYIYDEIGYWGNSASEFLENLKQISASSIVMHVNSPGGDVFDAMAIMNGFRNHPASVRAEVDGIAASAASFIIQAADHIVMMPGSQLMIHDASGFCFGNASEMRELADELEKCSDLIAKVYADRSGKDTQAEWRDRMLATSWYTPEEAVAVGLADEVVDAGKRKKPCAEAPRHPMTGERMDIVGMFEEIRTGITTRIDTDLIRTGVELAANNRPAEPLSVKKTDNRVSVSAAIREGLAL